MRFRAGLVIGFGAGYYLGTMAGQERHEQINQMFRKVKRSEAFDVATDKAKEVIDLGVDKAKDVVEQRTGNGNGAASHTDSPYTDPRLQP